MDLEKVVVSEETNEELLKMADDLIARAGGPRPTGTLSRNHLCRLPNCEDLELGTKYRCDCRRAWVLASDERHCWKAVGFNGLVTPSKGYSYWRQGMPFYFLILLTLTFVVVAFTLDWGFLLLALMSLLFVGGPMSSGWFNGYGTRWACDKDYILEE